MIAGRTGIGVSQRAQQFVVDPKDNPFNVIEPGKRPRVTLTPSIALKDGKPWLAFAVQGGDSQDQNLLQFFLNVVEFGMTPQEAVEASNFNSYQMKSSFDDHKSEPGRLMLNATVPEWVRRELRLQGLHARVRGPQLRPDQRDHARPRARHDVGRLEQPRRGLRHRLVMTDRASVRAASHGAACSGSDARARARRRRARAASSRLSRVISCPDGRTSRRLISRAACASAMSPSGQTSGRPSTIMQVDIRGPVADALDGGELAADFVVFETRPAFRAEGPCRGSRAPGCGNTLSFDG